MESLHTLGHPCLVVTGSLRVQVVEVLARSVLSILGASTVGIEPLRALVCHLNRSLVPCRRKYVYRRSGSLDHE